MRMMKLQIFSIIIVIAAVNCDGDPPPGECKPCDDTIKRVFEMFATFAKVMEPVTLNDVEICKKVIVTGLSTISPRGKSCMISNGANKWQQSGLGFKKLNVECHIIPLKEFGKRTGINIPIPSLGIPSPSIPGLSVPGLGTDDKARRIIVANATDLYMDFVSRINVDDNSFNVTKLEMEQGKLDSMLVSLTGDTLFTKLGELITKPKTVRASIGFVIKFVLRHVLGLLTNNVKLADVITMLNCGDAGN